MTMLAEDRAVEDIVLGPSRMLAAEPAAVAMPFASLIRDHAIAAENARLKPRS